MTERIYICENCETEHEEFPIECSECGGTEFKTVTGDEQEDEEEETIMDEMAKFTRPLNPVAPA